MWIFFKTANPQFGIGLLAGKEYKVGRLGSHINGGGDSSVSRCHAVVKVVLEPGDSRPRVFVKDPKSTYGTYVGEAALVSSQSGSQADRVRAGEEMEIMDGMRVRFGLHSTIYQLKWIEKLTVCSSNLKAPESAALQKNLAEKQVGKFTSGWKDSVTHLVMKEVVLTVKVANALAKGVPIVTPNFFADFNSCLNSQQILPDPKDYIPRYNEDSFNENDISLCVNKARQTLFRGKTFVFPDEGQMMRFEVAIGYAGGKSILMSENKPDPDMFKVPANVLIDAPIGRSQGQTQNGLSHWQKCANVTHQSGLNLIPEQHIGRAILTLKADIFCNPAKSIQVLGSQRNSQLASGASEILAPETQLNKTKLRSFASTTKEIPETLPSGKSQQKRKVPTKIFHKPRPVDSQTQAKTPTDVESQASKFESQDMVAHSTPAMEPDDDLFDFDPSPNPSKRKRSSETMSPQKKQKIVKMSSPPPSTSLKPSQTDDGATRFESQSRKRQLSDSSFLPPTEAKRTRSRVENESVIASAALNDSGRCETEHSPDIFPPTGGKRARSETEDHLDIIPPTEGKRTRNRDDSDIVSSSEFREPKIEIQDSEDELSLVENSARQLNIKQECGDDDDVAFITNEFGFIGKNPNFKRTGFKAEAGEPTLEELTRSYAQLEVKPLVVRNVADDSAAKRPAAARAATNNAKTFRKQRLVRGGGSRHYVSMRLHQTKRPSSPPELPAEEPNPEPERLEDYGFSVETPSQEAEHQQRQQKSKLWEF